MKGVETAYHHSVCNNLANSHHYIIDRHQCGGEQIKYQNVGVSAEANCECIFLYRELEWYHQVCLILDL